MEREIRIGRGVRTWAAGFSARVNNAWRGGPVFAPSREVLGKIGFCSPSRAWMRRIGSSA